MERYVFDNFKKKSVVYIKTVEIKNIKSIQDFRMDFENPAGWHVVIADNGAGKSTLIRSIAAVLIGPREITAILPVWKEWLSKSKQQGSIELEIGSDWDFDSPSNGGGRVKGNISNKFTFNRNSKTGGVSLDTNEAQKRVPPVKYNWGTGEGWFSVSYGTFRRFTGGDEKRTRVFHATPKAGAHLSAFGEDVALTEALSWLEELDNRRLREERAMMRSINNQAGLSDEEREKRLAEGRKRLRQELEPAKIINGISRFINQSALLPHGAQFDGFDLDGNLLFVDGKGYRIPVIEMSDGYRSVLSMIFELIRQMVRTYGVDRVFAQIMEGEVVIEVPGVVMVDEVDAHLHPSWQTRIGEWFTQFFPKIQFIVTTHSPLICRSAVQGSIWRLATPGKEEQAGEVTGIERARLIDGNILDAYGTELFGQSPVVRTQKSEEKLERLGELNAKFALGNITEEENQERLELTKTLSTDDPTGF